jgi:hypothetical protein
MVTTRKAEKSLIKRIEERYSVRYIGYYEIPLADGRISSPMYVFYQENPKTELGHSHYMGYLAGVFDAKLVNAVRITEARYPAIIVEGKIICSRHNHDFQALTCGAMIDGGLGPAQRWNHDFPVNAHIVIRDGREVVEHVPLTDIG